MLRPRLVRSLLLSELVGVRATALETAASSAAAARQAVADARRRSLAVATLLAAGLIVLLVTRADPTSFLSFVGEGRVFASGALVVAAFAGFRLGQWEKLGAVNRALDELPVESGEED